jgi:DNA polymerase V
MGTPYFKVKDVIQKNNVAVFSSNYALYADMSNRIMQTLSNFTPSMEIYSIDEAFLGLDGIQENLDNYGRTIRQTILKWTGIPVSVGIAKTKTLAKIANHLAKTSQKANGVLDLSQESYITPALERTDVEDVWGVGRRISERLKRVGIKTAQQLAQADIDWIQKTFSIMTVRTVLELRGQKCFELEEVPEPNKNITVSRSFGKDVETLERLEQALSVYVSRAGEKLRSQKLHAQVLTVFAMSNRFDRKNAYYNSACMIFETATDSSLDLVDVIGQLVKRVYREKVKFKKAGVVLSKLIPANQLQLNLFTDRDRTGRDRRLMETLDRINERRKQVYFASEGVIKPWQTKFDPGELRGRCVVELLPTDLLRTHIFFFFGKKRYTYIPVSHI